jgi:acyl-CoA hydrolase
VIAIAAARVDEELIDTPVLDLLAEGEDAQLSHDVKLAGVVEMQHIGEELGVTVEVELTLNVIVVIAEFQNGLSRVAEEQTAQACLREAQQRMGTQPSLEATHIDADLSILDVGIGHIPQALAGHAGDAQAPAPRGGATPESRGNSIYVSAGTPHPKSFSCFLFTLI